MRKKWVTLGELGQFLEKRGHNLYKGPQLEKWVILRKISHTWKNGLDLEKNGSHLEKLVTLRQMGHISCALRHVMWQRVFRGASEFKVRNLI